MMNEDWNLLLSFFPSGWKELAAQTHAVKGLRKNKSEENLLRTLLLHLACGYSLRETVVRAKQAQLAELSDVALLKRLKKSKGWLCAMCVCLFEERGLTANKETSFQARLFDATSIKEPGQTGSLWRVHYSVRVPSLQCDFFRLTKSTGEGTGESLKHFPMASGDYILADRGYSHGAGIAYAHSKHAYVAIRLNPQSLRIKSTSNRPFPLLNPSLTIRSQKALFSGG